jgi:hypothetical protein
MQAAEKRATFRAFHPTQTSPLISLITLIGKTRALTTKDTKEHKEDAGMETLTLTQVDADQKSQEL